MSRCCSCVRTGTQTRCSSEVRHLRNDILPSFHVLGVFDDRARVVQMWQSAGILTLDCGQGVSDFDSRQVNTSTTSCTGRLTGTSNARLVARICRTPCAYCPAEKMLWIAPPDSPWTCKQSLAPPSTHTLRKRNLDRTCAQGTARDHWGNTRLRYRRFYHGSVPWSVWTMEGWWILTTDLSKLKFIKRAWQDEPSDYDLCPRWSVPEPRSTAI